MTMKKALKHILCITLSLVMLLSAIPLTEFTAKANEIPEQSEKIAFSSNVEDNYLIITLYNEGINNISFANIVLLFDASILRCRSFKWSDYVVEETNDELFPDFPNRAYNISGFTEIEAEFFNGDVFDESKFDIAIIKFEIIDTAADITQIRVESSVSFSGADIVQNETIEIVLNCSHIDVNNDYFCDKCNNDTYTDTGTFSNGNIEWKFYEDGTLIISGNGDMENYSHGGYGSPWYNFRTEIRKVIIKEGVTSVGNAAFEGCENLTAIELDDSIQSINWRAFAGCKKLADIELPENLTAIGQAAFEECEMLANISFPEKLKSISSSAFAYSGLTGKITIPAGVTEILDSAFTGCNKLTVISVDSGNSVYISENGVLINKREKTLMLYPMGKTQKEYIIPDNIENIAANAFSGNNYIENIVISNSVKNIGFRAFTDCTALKSMKIPMAVRELGGELFDGCTSIKSIYFYGSNILIPYGKYDLCLPKGTSVYGYNNSTAIEYVEYINHVYESEYHKFVSLGDYIGKVEVIDSGSFGSNLTYSVNNLGVLTISGQGDMNDWEGWDNPFIAYRITEIIIENGITSIGNYAFIDYGKVKKVTIPDSVTRIGECAFMSCYSLTSITIPEKVKTIGRQAFSYTHLTKITIQNADTVIESPEPDGSENVPNTIDPETAIYGYNNSTAKKYAENYGNEFVSIDHVHKYTSAITTQPTCGKEGVKTFTCTCGSSYTEAIAKLAAHTWGAWKVTKAATYEAEGREERSCSVCKKTEGRVISKLEYKEIEITATEEVKPLGEDAVLVLSDASVGEIIKNTKGNVSVTDKDGKAVSEKDSVASGMTVTLKDASGKVIDEKTIVVPGDNNGDGKITAADARSALRASVSLDKLNTWQTSASNVDKTAENKITAADARFILRASVGLEKFSEWIKTLK